MPPANAGRITLTLSSMRGFWEFRQKNLDLFFHTPKVQRRLFQKHGEGKDLVVAEGVMGYYDGLRCSDPEGSTSEIAAALNLPSSLSFLAGEWDIRYCPF